MESDVSVLEPLRQFFRENYASRPGWMGRLKDADLRCIHRGATIVVRASDGAQQVAIRLANPHAGYAHRCFSLQKEDEVLCRMCGANPPLRRLFPKALHFEPRIPGTFEEFVEARPLCIRSTEQLRKAVEAIRTINGTPVTPELRRLLRRPVEERRLGWYFPKWIYRLGAASALLAADPAAPRHIARTAALATAVLRRLRREPLRYPRRLTVHFDGAHAGNFLFRRNGEVVIVDFDKASVRQDPTFTLVRFLASCFSSVGRPDPYSLFELGVATYLEDAPRPDFRRMAFHRLLEREISDLVGIIWDSAVSRRERFPEEEVAHRSAFVRRLLREMPAE